MEGSLFSMVLQSLLALAAVLGLFALLVLGMRRFQSFNGTALQRDFKIQQRIHLDNKNSIVEIRYRGSLYLLGVSANGGITQLRESDALPVEAADNVLANEKDV